LPFANDNAPHRSAGDLINDYARVEPSKKRSAHSEGASTWKSSARIESTKVRIGRGEGARVAYAGDSNHPILEVIASDTRLTLVEVQEEQQARVAESTRRLQKPSEPTAA